MSNALIFADAVKAGNIPHIIEKGRKRGMRFPKDAIYVHLQMMKKDQEKLRRTFDRATNADLWTAIEYDRALYGEEDIISYKRAMEWQARNNEIFMMMKDDSELSGITTFVPLEESTIKSLVQGKIKERNIPDWAIRKWDESDLSVYIATISIFPTGNSSIDKGRGRSLISYTIRWAIELHRQYDIKNWYAIGFTQEGRQLLRDLGFTAIEGTKEGYLLEDIEHALPTIQNFLKRIDRNESWTLPVPVQTPTSTGKKRTKRDSSFRSQSLE
jgi:hypothetical protein